MSKDFAEILTSRLKQAYPNFPVENHHSSLGKSVRIKVEEDFKSQKLKSIVCTSSLELGIDIGSIDFILHYMSPRQPARAIQRFGRSGHEFHRVSEGVIITCAAHDSRLLPLCGSIVMGISQRYLGSGRTVSLNW